MSNAIKEKECNKYQDSCFTQSHRSFLTIQVMKTLWIPWEQRSEIFICYFSLDFRRILNNRKLKSRKAGKHKKRWRKWYAHEDVPDSQLAQCDEGSTQDVGVNSWLFCTKQIKYFSNIILLTSLYIGTCNMM